MPPKGKDISALSASNAAQAQAAQTPAAAAPVPASAPVTTVAPVKKGKDFARMAPPPQPSVAPAAVTQTVATTTTSNTSSVPYGGGRPKGKDLSRMGGGPSAPAPSVSSSTSTAAPYSSTLGAAAPVQVPVPNNMEQRHEIARRKAFGLDANNNPTNMRSPPLGYQNYSQPIGQHRPLVPNASQPIDIKVAKAKQPTKRPSHAESRLSSAKTDDKYGNASLAPAIGMKLQKLCHSIDPSYTLDSEVQERLVEMADSFVEKVTKDAVRLARHRGSSRLDVVDVALALKKGYNISVPGLGPPQRGKGQGAASLSAVGSTATAGNQFGGWLFADKVTVPAEGGAKKKRRTSNAAASGAT